MSSVRISLCVDGKVDSLPVDIDVDVDTNSYET